MPRFRNTPRARRQAAEAEDWWRRNRTASPDLFFEEFLKTLDLLEDTPDMGSPVPRKQMPGLRRVLLPLTRYHGYYVHDEIAGELVILAVWSAVRGRGPRLGPVR